MPPFDALMITAAHLGQGMVMNEVIDPAVVEEDDPLLSCSATAPRNWRAWRASTRGPMP